MEPNQDLYHLQLALDNLHTDYAELLGENESLRCKLIDCEAALAELRTEAEARVAELEKHGRDG